MLDGDGGASPKVEDDDLSDAVRLASCCRDCLVEALSTMEPLEVFGAFDGAVRGSKVGTSLSGIIVGVAGDCRGS